MQALAKRTALATKDAKAEEAAERERVRLRMRKCREDRKLQIEAIENENVKRVAALLNTMKNDQD